MSRRFSSELVAEDTCPRCLSELDTGWECDACGFDAMPFVIRDWTYSEGCGCKITFFAESRYKTSRMLPGETCTDHTGQYQVAEQDCLVERAKKYLKEYIGQRLDAAEETK